MSTPVSPVKGLSVREDHHGSRALHTKTGKQRYKCIANFYFIVDAFVKFPGCSKYNGFLLNVHRTDGVAMECFVMCDEMENAKKFKAAINRTFSEHGGVFWQGISDQQLTTYNMDLMDDFATTDGRVILGSLVIGRQPNPRKVDENGQFVDDDNINPTPKEMDDYDSAVYIINEKLQVNRDGVIPEANWTHRWMIPFLKCIPAALADKTIRNFLHGNHQVHLSLPLQAFNWDIFIGRAKLFFKSNFMPFIHFLSGAIALFHYQKILTCTGACPVPTAIGDTASGKSTALRLISDLMGMQMVSQSSGEFIVSDVTKTTFPLCWDDPTHRNILRTPLVSVFNGLGNQTQGRGNEKPMTSFLLTMNFEMDDDMRSFERTTPIWFQKLVTSESEVPEEFLEGRKEIFSLATTHCLIDVIRLSQSLDNERLATHIGYFKTHLSGLPSRLAEIYSIYRLFTHEIVELVANESVISCESFDSYLTKKFLPYVRSLYDKTVKMLSNIEDFFNLLVQAITQQQTKKHELDKWMRNSVKGKKDSSNYIAFIVPQALREINTSGLQAPSDKNVRDLVNHINGGTSDGRLSFLQNPKVCCAKVPRTAVNEDLLRQIDTLFGDTMNTESDVDMEEQQPCTQCDALTTERNEIRDMHKREMAHTKAVFKSTMTEAEERYKERIGVIEKEKVHQQKEIESLKSKIKHLQDELQKPKGKETEKLSTTQCMSVVAQKVTQIVEQQASQNISESSLDDSGVGGDLMVVQEGESSNNTQKRRSIDHPVNTSKCNICRKKKKSNMVKCTKCTQWQHCKCAGILYGQAIEQQNTFLCKDCKK